LINNYCYEPFKKLEYQIDFLKKFIEKNKKNNNEESESNKISEEMKQMIEISQDLINNEKYLINYENSKNFLEKVEKNTTVCLEFKSNLDLKKSLYQLDRLLLDFQSKYNRNSMIIGILCLSDSKKYQPINDLLFVNILDKIRLIKKTFKVELVILNVKDCFYGFEIVNNLEINDIIEKKISIKYEEKIDVLKFQIKELEEKNSIQIKELEEKNSIQIKELDILKIQIKELQEITKKYFNN